MQFACKFAKQVHSSPTWKQSMPLPGSSQTGVRLARMLCQIPLLKAMDMKVRTCWSGKLTKKNIIFALIFECRKIRNLPFWQIQKVGSVSGLSFLPRPGAAPWRFGKVIGSLGWLRDLPLSKSCKPRKALSELRRLLANHRSLYWRLKVPLRFSQIHPQTAFLGLWKNSSLSKTFFEPRWLEKRYQVPAGLQQGWSSLKKTYLGNLGPLWSSWWLAWPSHLRPTGSSWGDRQSTRWLFEAMGGFMWEKLDSHVKSGIVSWNLWGHGKWTAGWSVGCTSSCCLRATGCLSTTLLTSLHDDMYFFFLDPGGFQHTKLKKPWNFKINTLDISTVWILRYCYIHKLHKYVLAQKLFILGWKSPKLTMQTTWLMRFRVT